MSKFVYSVWLSYRNAKDDLRETIQKQEMDNLVQREQSTTNICKETKYKKCEGSVTAAQAMSLNSRM
jgi:hypothetical protein